MPQLAVKQLLPGSTGQVIATRAGVSVWEKLKPDALNGVTPAAGQVPYIASTSTFGASSDFTWDNSNKRLSVAGSVYLKGVLFDDQIAAPEETSSSSSSGANSKGVLWVRAGEPNTLVYTDNQGTDTTLGGGGGLSGSGTLNTVAKFTGAAALGNSSITDTGALVSCSVPFSVPGVGSNSERLGSGATAAGANSLAVGNGADAPTADSTVIGYNAGNASLSGVSQTILGSGAGSALTNGAANTLAGKDAGNTLTTGTSNCLYGSAILTQAVNTSNSVGIGYSVIVSSNSVAIGYAATAYAQSTVVIGGGANGGTAAATSGVVLGGSAANSTFSGTGNVLIGSSVASSLAGGSSNTICGSSAGDTLTSGNNVCVYGYYANVSSSGTSNAVGIGADSRVAAFSISIGYSAYATATSSLTIGYNAQTISENTIVIGHSAGGGSSGALSGIIIGDSAANTTFSGSKNILIGSSVATALSSGTLNTICGSDAGDLLTTGGSNCLYGNNAETQATGTANSVGVGAGVVVHTDSIAIGSGATTTASNQFVAGSSSYPATNVFFGKGASNATPTTWTLNGTASSGAAAGGDISICGGTSTSGVGGSVNIRTAATTTLETRGTVDPNGNSVWTQGIQSGSSPTFARWTAAAHTSLVASTEAIDIDFALNRTVAFTAGAITTQRAFVVRAPSYNVGDNTITTAATVAITGAPSIGGGGGEITNPLALWVQAGAARFDGGLLNTLAVSAHTSATVTVTAADSGKVFTNEGTSANVQFNLPAAAAGLTYTFIQQDSVDLVKIQTTGDDTIRDGSVVTAAPGYIKSTARGDTVTLVAINATEWMVTYGTGNWTFDA